VYEVLPLDYASAKAAGKLRHTLEAAGTPIGLVDQLIAGIALANDLTVVTRNTREFARVPGLRVENWYD
jgi:tRNA(fMet)-specific endonuclease VapC